MKKKKEVKNKRRKERAFLIFPIQKLIVYFLRIFLFFLTRLCLFRDADSWGWYRGMSDLHLKGTKR